MDEAPELLPTCLPCCQTLTVHEHRCGTSDNRRDILASKPQRRRQSRFGHAALLLGVALTLSGCLTRVAEPPLPYIRPANEVPQIDPARVRMASRMEGIEGELQRLRVMIEQLQHAAGNEGAIKQLQERVALIERRLGIEASGGISRDGTLRQGPGSPPPAEEQTGLPPSAPPQMTTPGNVEPQRVEITNEQVPPDERAYREAYLLVRRNAFGEAIPLFEAFLRNHSGSKYAVDATYWLGEALLAQGRADEAVLQFDRVIKEYSGSKKELSALLRQGEAFTKMGDTQSARIILEKLVKDHPHSPQARSAQGKLKALPRL